MSIFAKRSVPVPRSSLPMSDPVLADDRFITLKVNLHQRLIDVIDLSVIEKMPRELFESEIGDIIRDMLAKETTLLNDRERKQLVADILDELLGLGPLEPLLKDASISDIIVNTHRQVFVERNGQIDMTSVRFKDEDHLVRIINKIVAAVGRRIDESQPIVDARLADGSRVNAVIPPASVDGALLSIRKFAKLPYDLPRLVGAGTISPHIEKVLEVIVRGRLNVLISGGTGAGKTTMLNAMSSAIGHRESLVTIEDAAELQLQQPMVRRLETRPENIEGKGEITQRDLVKTALRMRPDRIIIGEVRGAEALDMLQAMNTGHVGSMSTIHANTPRDALSRLEQMISMAGFELAPHSIRSQIASAIDIVIQLARGPDGKRRVISLQEVEGMDGEVVTTNEIFRFRRTATDENGIVHGQFESTGIRPRFANDVASLGLVLAEELFTPTTRSA
ncbi:MAG TPA: CpaF family protein [Acetobacteraceae bacterium]|nr:CpaF family protein [Acetobacteraceae bacterium]